VRTPLARPDLFHFLELDGHVYNLKVVVLQRSLADAVRSVYRAGYHGGTSGCRSVPCPCQSLTPTPKACLTSPALLSCLQRFC